MRNGAVIVVLMMVLGVSQVMADENRPEVGKYAKVFKSYSQAVDLTVIMVRLGPKEDNQALIQFSGIDSKWDGKIMKHQCNIWGANNDKLDCCTIEITGDKYCSLIGRNGWFGGYEAYLPDMTPDTINVYYDKEGSRQVNSEHFLTEYLKQQAAMKEKPGKK